MDDVPIKSAIGAAKCSILKETRWSPIGLPMATISGARFAPPSTALMRSVVLRLRTCVRVKPTPPFMLAWALEGCGLLRLEDSPSGIWSPAEMP